MIRKATIQDIKSIHKLLGIYGQRGELLPRPLSELYDHVRDFTVFIDPAVDRMVGCCALQFCWEDLAEIRSLAVHPDFLRKGIGAQLMQVVLDEAATFDTKRLFTLTYQPDFFRRFGFTQIDRAELPLKIWADCILCVKFPECDEIAMMKELST